MVWDAVRAIDYLCSRPDVDADKIGCTGNSGGGNLTSYLMAYDDRIAAAAPGCFMTTHRRKNEKPGPGDAEQNLFAQIRDGFDHPDFILTRAPKPTLILSATKDFVPIEGSWEALRQAKRVYTVLGFPERELARLGQDAISRPGDSSTGTETKLAMAESAPSEAAGEEELEADLDTLVGHELFGLGHGKLPEMENTGS